MVIDILSTLILVIGLGDDLRSRKIHNNLLIGLLLLALLVIFTMRGFDGLGYGLVSMSIGLALMLPLVYMKALGAGDMKLYGVFAFTSNPIAVMWILLYSLAAGAVLGLTKAAIGGELKSVLTSTAVVALHKDIKPSGHHTIPFSAALLLGWLTYASLNLWGLWL